MDEVTHPLLTKRMGGAFAVIVAGFGIGLALMTFSSLLLRAVGMTIAIAGATGGAWIYWDDFKLLRLRLAHRQEPDKPLHAEQWIVLVAIVATIVVPAYVWVWQSWPAVPSSRHLTAAQRALMRPLLEPAPNYVIQINSIPNCEECEDYAVELREFFASLNGWAVSGGVLIFPFDPHLRIGVHLITDVARTDIDQRLRKAFDAAHVEIIETPPEKLGAGTHAVMLVGKSP